MWSRRRLAVLVAAVLLLVGVLFAGVVPTSYDRPVMIANPVDHVNTLIGTGTGGKTVGEINNFPGATVPFGMVQYSPDTVGNYAGYNFANDQATGFSMTHASVGCPAFGDISMLPTTTPTGTAPWRITEKIAHDHTEVGVPGYYTVRFPATGVTAELTATTHTGVGRFSYPNNGQPALLYVNSAASLGGTTDANIQIGDDNTITGSATSGKFCGKDNVYTVFFAMKFSRPFTSYGTWDGHSVSAGARSAHSAKDGSSGAYLEFPAGSLVEVRTALSYVSVDGARANLAAEGKASFGDVRTAASKAWNVKLSRITIASASDGDVATFYTALYHSLLHPNTFNDVDRRYIGFDGKVHTTAVGHTQYANFSDWDTYRGLAALQGMLFPDQTSDMAQSLVNDAEQSGSFPRWALANAATGEMTGDNVVPLIATFYTFGAKNFDVHTALRYMINAATQGGAGRTGYVERPGIASYLQHGYLPLIGDSCNDGTAPAASITLEWSLDDFTISRFADALGDSRTATQFQHRAQNWQNLFNPSTHFISPRNELGLFPTGPAVVPPAPGCFSQLGFDEGNAEQYLWYVPQNIAGLVTALGGRKAVGDRLDRFTTQINVGPEPPYLWAGNEPEFAVPWLYNYIGQPWKTQRLVDRVRSELFSPTPDGEPGNDDLGAMSSWFVWAALGLYPSTPGTTILTVNTPLFDHAVIALPAGKFIEITAPGASGRGRLRYIKNLSIDGQPTDRTYLPESILHTGGEVAFTLFPRPNEGWGTQNPSAPPSFGAGSSTVTVNTSPDVVEIAPGGSANVTVDLQRMIDGPGGYTITGTGDNITAGPTSGQFTADGSGTARVAITADPSAPQGQHPLALTVKAGDGARTVKLIVVVDRD